MGSGGESSSSMGEGGGTRKNRSTRKRGGKTKTGIGKKKIGRMIGLIRMRKRTLSTIGDTGDELGSGTDGLVITEVHFTPQAAPDEKGSGLRSQMSPVGRSICVV